MKIDSITTILFDVDGTLLDFDAYEKKAFQYALNSNNIPFTEELYARYHVINKNLWKRHELGQMAREALIYIRFRELFAEFHLTCDEYQFEAVYQEQLAQGCHYMPGAMELLRYLKPKYALYLVTNGIARTQVQKIHTSGIADYMQNIFISENIGYQKPCREFFEACFLQIPNFLSSQTLIIGDSLSSDIKGGNHAGIRTCWYNPMHELNDGTAVADYEIQRLQTLMDWL